MKRHYTNYFKGIAHFKDYRTKLVTSSDLDEVLEVLNYIETHAIEFEWSHYPTEKTKVLL
jgi:hypothetical protein